MSPEQLRGEPLDGRSDLFSLGALFYTLVVGRWPFEGVDLAAIASQVLYKRPGPPSESISGLPPSLDGVIARALMKSPDERYATGEELAEDLLAVRRGVAPAGAISPAERTRAGGVRVPPSPPTESRESPRTEDPSASRLETRGTLRSGVAPGLIHRIRLALALVEAAPRRVRGRRCARPPDLGHRLSR
jgi:serine/threonine-protein kinase